MPELTSDAVIEAVEAHSEEIKSFGVKELQLFGSYARGNQSEDSDIDLLVEFEDGRGLFDDYIGLKRLLEELFDSEIDLVKKEKVREELADSILRGENIGAEI